jgi:hypothetical protein
MLTINTYSEEALETVKSSNFLKEEDWSALCEMQNELQDTFEKKQMWRTETEMRVSVLNNIKHPTKASKYWQCVKEQSVFFENLVALSFDYRRNDVEIKRLQKKIREATDDLDIEEFKIDLEEALYKKKNMEVAAKDRMRELKLWSKIKNELNDNTFDTENVDTHQLESYTQRYLLETATAVKTNAQMSGAEARNLLGQTETMLVECDKRGILNKVINVLDPQMKQTLLPRLGLKLIDENTTE